MGHAITVRGPDGLVKVDGRDVGDAEGLSGAPDPEDPIWLQAAERYVDGHPPLPHGKSEAQRVEIIRALAAGPADTRLLLRRMRVAGWVGASDLENRLRELTPGGGRGLPDAVALPIEVVDGRHRLTRPLPILQDEQVVALGHLKALAARQPTPLAVQALQLLDGLLPGVGAHSGQPGAPTMTLPTQDLRRFEQARVTRRPVHVGYHSMNSGREKRYRLVPVEYVPAGPALKAICVEVASDGTVGRERQFALDRIRRVDDIDDADPVPPEQLQLQREVLHLVVMRDLYRIMHDRNQFNIREFEAVELADAEGSWEVRGTFPAALGWDVMEQMCAWAGSVVILEPLWLVSAVMRRLRAGLAAMEDHAMRLVKPDPTATFDDLAAALFTDDEPAAMPTGPRKLAPPR